MDERPTRGVRIGVVVNPVAGLGGSVALKGSDGEDTLRRALSLGAVPRAPDRAEAALRVLAPWADDIEVLSAPGIMGEREARAAGLRVQVVDLRLPREGVAASRAPAGLPATAPPATASSDVPRPGGPPPPDDTLPPLLATTPAHTRAAVLALVEAGVDLLLFAGGDGTARDVYDALTDPCRRADAGRGSAAGAGALDPHATAGAAAPGARGAPAGAAASDHALPATSVVGIPAGCKIHSAVYAATPAAAGELARRYLAGLVPRVTALEVMDIDEEAFRRGEVVARLYGFLRVPEDRRLVQGAKVGGRALSETAAAQAIAERVVEGMEPGRLYLIGPGSTTGAIKERLGLSGTLLGVDAIRDGRLIARDATEAEILGLLGSDHQQATTIVVTVIGGQGYVFGRGNQQLSPAVLRRIGHQNVLVVATPGKVAALPFGRLRVDTGDPETDVALQGYRRVITSYSEEAVLRVE